MSLLAVNYHYIDEPGRYPHPGIYPTPARVLREQIRALGRTFEFVSQRQVLDALRGIAPLPDLACLLTFDDGLRSQFEAGLQVLDEEGVPGMFFFNSLPYAEGKATLVHKIHYCRANTPPEEFRAVVEGAYLSETGAAVEDSEELPGDAVLATLYPYDTAAVASFKYLLNVVLPFDLRTRIIDRAFHRLVASEREFSDELYMTREQVREVHARRSLGTHTHAHVSLARLSPAEIQREIRLSVETLEHLVGGTVRSVSYPWGNPRAVSREVGDVARRCGLEFGFTMERSVNVTLDDPLLLARISTNDVDDVLDETGKIASCRARYFSERSDQGASPTAPNRKHS